MYVLLLQKDEDQTLLKCHVIFQKETGDGPPMHEECGEAVAVEGGHAGLCE